ncbi:hypothetical protein Ahy_B05g074940 isoform I [Arachis hypogaea]|uniref:Uncharacterized protein n=1 Tax=Arachis hypogaea TaxID=3818 RepID=A0A444Z0I1_ARAHY|nr:hypothetical protein Ahy_B05g074940 isoform I [Arachis hypogaea]
MNLRSHTYYIGMQLKKLMVYGFTMKMNVKKLQISLIGWAFDILGWGFSDLAEKLTSCDVVSKHEHFYQLSGLRKTKIAPSHASLIETPVLWLGRLCIFYALLKIRLVGSHVNPLVSGII